MDELFCVFEERHEPHEIVNGLCCGSVTPHAPHGDCPGLMADDGSNAEWF